MWIFRTHDIGTPYTVSYRKVRNRYISEIKRGVLPTQTEMDEWIKRKMDERPHNATFSIDVDPEMAEAMKQFPQWSQAEIQGYFDQGWDVNSLQDWLENQ